MKKFIISEEEKSRILGMHQEATKRHYLGEQYVTPEATFVDKQGAKYYVPKLDQSSFGEFVNFNEFDNYKSKLNMLSSLGVKSDIQNNPLSVPSETIDRELQQFTNKFTETKDRETAMNGLNFLKGIETLENALSTSIMVYLKKWRPNSQGMNLINNVAFQNDPSIQSVKRIIPNINEILPKVLDMKSKKTGIKVA
jgi:hypothetical protein